MATEKPNSPAKGRLEGRRIVITGAASGIGRATAERFLAEGATVALLDRNSDTLHALFCQENAHCFAVDITDEDAVALVTEQAAQKMGGIDGVVNAAGIMAKGSILDVPANEWRKQIEVNLVGTYIVSRNCLRWMTDDAPATIVNIASAAGLLPNAPGLTAYAASKGGVINLTRCMAAELAPRIRVNSVCPGMVDTPMADGYRANVGNYALKRLADPEEICAAILFLTSSESSYVTGAALAVDGGRSFH